NVFALACARETQVGAKHKPEGLALSFIAIDSSFPVRRMRRNRLSPSFRKYFFAAGLAALICVSVSMPMMFSSVPQRPFFAKPFWGKAEIWVNAGCNETN